MRQRTYIFLGMIVLITALVIWVNVPNNGGIHIGSFDRSLETVLGLDLRGGLQVLLEVDLPANSKVETQSMEDTKTILENRTNALGVSENVFQVAGERRIVGEFPGVSDPEKIIKVIRETGMLEFVDMGSEPVAEGTVILTDFGQDTTQTATATPTPQATPTASATPAVADAKSKVWHTVMTGKDLKTVSVSTDTVQGYVVNFELSSDGAKVFRDYTTANTGKYLAIVLDKKVISTPRISVAITEGKGLIEGGFTYESANALAVQLRYGALPIPLKVVESRVIGPSLGQDSLNKSLRAGIIGFIIVFLFMLLYYRMPGVVADVSIIIYALVTLALFKLIPVTITLPGIAGFLLSTGSALDANILIFERFKEELRSGKTFAQAVDLGFKRAWSSIRDSNIATVIICLLLFWFGSSFGATIVKGFAFTLLVGVVVSLFTALFVSRTLLTLLVDWMKPKKEHLKWFGILE